MHNILILIYSFNSFFHCFDTHLLQETFYFVEENESEGEGFFKKDDSENESENEGDKDNEVIIGQGLCKSF